MSTATLKKFNKSFTVQRIDEDQRLVYGIASSPTLDGQDEIVTTEAMREALPEFMKWANLRYMHNDGRIDAVGKVIDAHIGPDGKTYITAKVVDDSAWAKVKAGVLQAFSIGGEILESARQWIKDRFVNVITRITLNEISLVDNPAHKEARILMYKMNTPKGITHMSQMLEQPVLGGSDNDEALADVRKATLAISQVKKRAKPTMKKAAAPPDPDKLVNQLLNLHNSLVLAGNMDGADSVTDAIACLQMAVSDPSASATDQSPDPNQGDVQEGADMGGGVPMAYGAGLGDDDSADSEGDEDQGDDPLTKADGVDEGADNDAEGGEGGATQQFSMDGTNITQTTDNTTSPDEVDDNQPNTPDPVQLSQRVATRKAQTVKSIVPARVQAIRQARQFETSGLQMQKAMMNEFQKFATGVAEVLVELKDRIEQIETRPVGRGPMRMQVAENREVVKGMGNSTSGSNKGAGDALASQIAELEATIRNIGNPQERQRAGEQLFVLQAKQARGVYS